MREAPSVVIINQLLEHKAKEGGGPQIGADDARYVCYLGVRTQEVEVRRERDIAQKQHPGDIGEFETFNGERSIQ